MWLTGREGVSILSGMVHALGKTNMKNKSEPTCMSEFSFRRHALGNERWWGRQLWFLYGKGGLWQLAWLIAWLRWGWASSKFRSWTLDKTTLLFCGCNAMELHVKLNESFTGVYTSVVQCWYTAQRQGFATSKCIHAKMEKWNQIFVCFVWCFLRQGGSQKKLWHSLDFHLVPGTLQRGHHCACPAPSHSTGERENAPPAPGLSSFSPEPEEKPAHCPLHLKL